MSDGGITIDGDTFHPIPESWIEAPDAVDRGEGRPRLFAVSAARISPKALRIRYAHPDTEEVLVFVCGGMLNDQETGFVPSNLRETGQTWARSLVPPGGVDPVDVLRATEIEHFDTLWGERLGLGSDGHRAVADGGEHRA